MDVTGDSAYAEDIRLQGNSAWLAAEASIKLPARR